jgi:hypothetical protein
MKVMYDPMYMYVNSECKQIQLSLSVYMYKQSHQFISRIQKLNNTDGVR